MAQEKLLPTSDMSQMPHDPFGQIDFNHELYGYNADKVLAKREEVMRGLLGVDYDHARETGLLDEFYYDPNTGADSLMHILGGDSYTNDEGVTVHSGFHHEPSARHPETKVISRKDGERPFEPYFVQAAIEGYLKQSKHTDPETGELNYKNETSTMFPKEYDALTVLKAIILARDGRDKALDKLKNGRLLAEGTAPLVDEETDMKIKLVLDPRDGRVIAAHPKITDKSKRRLLAEHYNEGTLPMSTRHKFVGL